MESPHLMNFHALILPPFMPLCGDTTSTFAPARSRAFFGLVSSTCSTPYVAMIATRIPLSFLAPNPNSPIFRPPPGFRFLMIACERGVADTNSLGLKITQQQSPEHFRLTISVCFHSAFLLGGPYKLLLLAWVLQRADKRHGERRSSVASSVPPCPLW